MTGIPVSDVMGMQNYVNPQTMTTGKKEETVQDSFQKVMGKITDEVISLQGQTESKSGADNAGRSKNAQEQGIGLQKHTADKDRIRDAAGQKTDRKQEAAEGQEEIREETRETIRESGEELVQDVAEEMNVSPEEVQAAMEVLGLSVTDLFAPENLRQLLLELSGCEDEFSLVTSGELYTSLQNLIGAAQEVLEGLQEELGLDAEELDTLLSELTAMQEETGLPEQTLPENAPEQMEGAQDYTVTVHRNGETVQVSVKVDEDSAEQSITEKVTDVQNPDGQNVTEKHKTADKGAADSGRQESGHGTEASATMLQAAKESDGAGIQTENLTQTSAPAGTYQSGQTQQIMDQIVDYMKFHLKSDVQEMEMQLHPASLGTVHVQIAAKAGSITAQFITQNETVRAAVESQIVALKEQFEEQGLKVDEVEVTVASHGEEQQFTREGKDAERGQEQHGRQTRRLNLDELEEDDFPADMEDSDRIAVEMMRANGGTVDYTA